MALSTRAVETRFGQSDDDAVSEVSQNLSDHEVETGRPLMAQSIGAADTQLRRLHGDAASEHQESQQSRLSMSEDLSDHEVETGQPLLQECDSEHANPSGIDEAKSDSLLDSSATQDLTRQPTSCRTATSPSTIGQAVLDVCITASSIYFMTFAFMAISQNGKSAASTTARHLLDAARLVNCDYA
jgi:hypothetical protein